MSETNAENTEKITIGCTNISLSFDQCLENKTKSIHDVVIWSFDLPAIFWQAYEDDQLWCPCHENLLKHDDLEHLRRSIEIYGSYLHRQVWLNHRVKLQIHGLSMRPRQFLFETKKMTSIIHISFLLSYLHTGACCSCDECSTDVTNFEISWCFDIVPIFFREWISDFLFATFFTTFGESFVLTDSHWLDFVFVILKPK